MLDLRNRNCLYYAIQNERIEAIKLLISFGIDLSVKYERSYTAWTFGLNTKNKIIEMMLKEAGADLHNKERKKPETVVCLYSNGKIELTIEDVKLMVRKNTTLKELLGKKEKPKEELWEARATRHVKKLMKMPSAHWFLEPVDVEKYGVYDYYKIIKNPMDFQTVLKKLTNKIYMKFEEFYEDVMLIFANCYDYNGVVW